MNKILKYLKNIWFKKQNLDRKKKLFLQDFEVKKTKKKGYKKRKNIHFQTSLDGYGNKKVLFYTYLSAGFLIIAAVIFIVFGNKFTVKKIEIVRQDNISNINLTYNAVDSFRGKSIFLVDKAKMIERIASYQNNIDTITIESILPDTLVIHIWSATQLFNTTLEDNSYIITSNGAFVPEKPNSNLKDLEIIFRDNKLGIVDYKKILSPEHMWTIAEIITQLEKNIINLEIVGLNYLPIEREIHITTSSDTILIFDIWEESVEQVERIAIFHAEHIPITQSGIVYIDVRIKNKVFFCSNDTRQACEDNLRNIYASQSP